MHPAFPRVLYIYFCFAIVSAPAGAGPIIAHGDDSESGVFAALPCFTGTLGEDLASRKHYVYAINCVTFFNELILLH